MNRWYFWVLAPIMLVTAIGLPFIVDGGVVVYVLSVSLLLATLGLAAPRRFRWPLKGVAIAVLLGYTAYAGTEAVEWWHGKPFGLGSPRGRTNLFNALRGLLVFGVPSILFLLHGRSGAAIDVLLDDKQEREPMSRRAVEQPDAADERAVNDRSS
jgi:hypothetical protein